MAIHCRAAKNSLCGTNAKPLPATQQQKTLQEPVAVSGGGQRVGVEPTNFFLSKLISVPCTAECIDVNQMIMLTS